MVRYMYLITVLLNHQRFLHLKLSFKLRIVYVLVLFIICFHMPNAFCLFVALLLNMPEMAHDWFNKSIHYVNVTVLIKFSQKTSVFTVIIISSP